MAGQRSVLDDLGEEVTGIMAPVSLCMAVTVLLVRLLNPEGVSSSNTVIIASIAYQEQASDSSGKKLGGALLNAIIFVGVVAGMTVILFLLFKYRCYKVIFAYMGFAVFNIFFFLTGALFVQVMQVIELHIDAFSLAYGLFNFSIVGTLGLLFVPIPLLAKQVYLIWVGIIVAYIFTFIPEWTAWVILVFMALYDIAAVLIPGGPLKALVELAIERQQELPALIYEARPAGGRPYVRGWGNRGATAAEGPSPGGTGGGVPAGTASGAPRPVAEASSPPMALEMRRPASRGQDRPASRPSSASHPALAAGADVRRSNDGAATAGGWTAAPSRLSHQSGGVETQVEALGSFDAHTVQWHTPQPRQMRGNLSPAGLPGSRPIGEGREQEWQRLPESEDQAPARHSRITRLSGAAGGSGALAASDSGRSTPVSGASQEPLIRHRGATAAEAAAEASLERNGGPAGVGESGAGSSRPTGGGGRRGQTEPGALSYDADDGAPGPSDPAAAAGRRGQTVPGEYLKGKGKGDDTGELASVPTSMRLNSTMGVRAVAPAFDAERLAEAVRRTTLEGELPPAAPPPVAGARPPAPQPHDVDLPDSIKLGLGDFIFYSMLVGRAAMYDFMTVFAAYLAIIAGLGLTLLCLAMFQKALPALPFSIALGVAFYFLTRLTLEPYLVPLAANLAYY